MSENTTPLKSEEKIACPACGFMNPATNNHCEKCGEDLREQQKLQQLLDTDPELVALNEKYAKQGMKRAVSGFAAVASAFVFYQWLEYDRFEFLSTIAMMAFPVALIVFIIFCCKRGSMKKKIMRMLEEKADLKAASEGIPFEAN